MIREGTLLTLVQRSRTNLELFIKHGAGAIQTTVLDQSLHKSCCWWEEEPCWIWDLGQRSKSNWVLCLWNLVVMTQTTIFSAPEPKAQVYYVDHALSVVRLSAVCPLLTLLFLTSPMKLLNGIQRNWAGSKISKSSSKFVFFGPISKTRWLPRPLIGWDIFDFFSETTDGNFTKLDRKQDLNVLYQFCVFRADCKPRLPPLPLIDWDIFDFFS